VERLIEMSDVDGILDFTPRLQVGDNVRLLSGPLADLVGRLERLDGASRARVLLSVMNGEIAVTVQAKDLAAA
jgi:transcriptional antiterminator RfaH